MEIIGTFVVIVAVALTAYSIQIFRLKSRFELLKEESRKLWRTLEVFKDQEIARLTLETLSRSILTKKVKLAVVNREIKEEGLQPSFKAKLSATKDDLLNQISHEEQKLRDICKASGNEKYMPYWECFVQVGEMRQIDPMGLVAPRHPAMQRLEELINQEYPPPDLPPAA